MPRPRSLTHSGIATAALAVIDREGFAALSMRAVAAELGMSTMSLYRYVTDREQLEALVVDLVLSGVDTTPPAGSSWSKRVAALVERIRDAVGAHPSVVPLVLTRRHTSETVLRWSETVLGVLTDAGFTGEQRVVALRSLLSYVTGAMQLEHLGPLSGPGTAVMANLPHAEYPLLADTARHAQRLPPDEEFRRGLTVMLRGLHPDVTLSISVPREVEETIKAAATEEGKPVTEWLAEAAVEKAHIAALHEGRAAARQLMAEYEPRRADG
jgi:AcrR family transcriptional regulator